MPQKINWARFKKDELLWVLTHNCRHGHTYAEHPNCLLEEKPNMSPVFERVGFLDIEASNLKANFGIVLSYCIKEEDGKIFERAVTPKEMRNGTFDKNLLKQCSEDLRKFDRIVVYYGADYRFDIPDLRTRAVMYNVDFPLYKEIKVLDLYPYIKKKFNFHSNRLAVACDFFGIAAKDHPIRYEEWLNALSGKKKALDYIVQHNREDVISTELLYKKILPYINIPNTSI